MYESRDRLMLPWSNESRESRFFNATLGILLFLMLVLSVVVSWVRLPEPDRATLEKLPPQLAKLVIKKEQPKPEPKLDKIEPEKEEAKPEEPKKEEPKPESKPEPKPQPRQEAPRRVEITKQPTRQTVEQARKVAEKKMETLMDDLADMRSSVDISALKKDVKPRTQSTIAAKASAVTSTNAVARSGGINTAGLAAPAEKISLAQHDGTRMTETKQEKRLAQAEAEAAANRHIRSNESIEMAAEKIKGSFNTHYLRELRKDPFLEGKVVLEVVIEPGGEVSACRLVSSELNHKALEAKFVSLMKLFNFGPEDVGQRTVNLPFTFKPS